MALASVIIGWVLASAPIGLLLGGAMRKCEVRSVQNLPRTLSPHRTGEEISHDAA